MRPIVGKKEQSSTVFGEKLGAIGGGAFETLKTLPQWDKSKIEQIDCTYFSEQGVPLYAFEVEASTPITTGIDRFLELLKVNPKVAGRLVIVAPMHRAKKLNAILRSSHYIGHPMYMENKLRYLYYEDLLKIYDRFVGKKPTWEALEQQLDVAVRDPKLDQVS